MVVLCLIFWGTFILFSIVTVSIYIPFTVQFPFFHILAKTWYVLFFLIIVILTGMRWYHIVVLIFISLMITDVEHLFMYLCVFFRKMYIQFLCSFLLRLLFLFLLLNYISSYNILAINLLLDMICKCFLPFHRLPFHFDVFLCCAEAF